jgi:MFS family permease
MPFVKERTQLGHRISAPARLAMRRARPAPPSARTAPQPAGPASPPPAAAPDPQPARLRGSALALILTAAFMVVLDFSIVNVALPSIETELGFPADAVQWIITAYAIAFGGLLILGGRAADLFGRRRMFIAGLLVFSAASLAGGLAHDPVLLAVIALAVAAAAAFVAVERHRPDPLVRADLLRRPGLRKASTMNLLLGLWNAGELIVLPLYFQQVLHDSALVTGLAIAPQGIIGFTAGVFGARLASRVGVRRVLVLTSAMATLGFLVLTRLPASGGYSPLLAAVMLVGFGTAGTAFGTMVTASHGVADDDQGLVGGVINTSRQIGAAIGAALLPAVAGAVDHGVRAPAASGDRAAMLAGAVAAALALVVALRGVRSTAPRTRHG